MARKEEFYYDSTSKITKIHAVRYIPDGEIKAILQIAHGMVEYIERYEAFALFLCSKGFLVTGNDHLGHGQSVNSKEEWGYFAKEDGNRAVLCDVYQLTKILYENTSELEQLHSSMSSMKKEGFMYTNLPVPLHTGSKKYYQEKRLLSK